jgi:hypothetical protein
MAEGDFDWGSFLANLVSGVNIPIGSAPDRSSSNQDVTFQYGENLPYLESMLGREMYGSNWNPPAAGAQPGATPPPDAQPPGTPVSPSSGLTSKPSQPGFQWDLTPGAGSEQPPSDGGATVPLPTDPTLQPGQTVPLPTDPYATYNRRAGGGSPGKRFNPWTV